MKKGIFFSRILSICLSIVILIGTVGIPADFHICQGKIKTVSIFGKAEKCSPLEIEVPCTKHSSNSIHKEKCCSNKSIYEKASLQSHFASSLNSASTNYTISPFHPEVSGVLSRASDISQIDIPDPPLVRQKISILVAYQTFLI